MEMEMEMKGSVVLDMRPNEQRRIIQLYDAAMTGDVTILHNLLQNYPLLLNESSLTALFENPLHIASSLGHLEFVRALLAKKPKLASEGDSLGRRPLHLASAEGHVEVVRVLLEADAGVCEAVDGEERTPLHLAAMRGRVEVVRELIRARPDCANMTCNGESVVHLCVKYCKLEALEVLVELLGDKPEVLKATDGHGNTVLHLAAQLSPLKVVRYLVSLEEVKANANALNSNGCTPLDLLDNCPKDFRNLQTQHLLIQIGGTRAKDITKSTPSPLSSPCCAISNNTKLAKIGQVYKNAIKYLTERDEWITDTHGSLMVVATVIATMSFQAVISPPGGVDGETGFAVFANKTNTSTYDDYMYFSNSNKVSFVASLSVILLHFGGFPLKNRMGTWLVIVAMCIAITYIFAAYRKASQLVSKNDLHLTYIFWKLVIGSVIAIHCVRFVDWLLQKMKGQTWPCKLLVLLLLAAVACVFAYVVVLDALLY